MSGHSSLWHSQKQTLSNLSPYHPSRGRHMALYRRRLFLARQERKLHESPVRCFRPPLPCCSFSCPPRPLVTDGLPGPRTSWGNAIIRPIYREYIGLSREEHPPRQWDTLRQRPLQNFSPHKFICLIKPRTRQRKREVERSFPLPRCAFSRNARRRVHTHRGPHSW